MDVGVLGGTGPLGSGLAARLASVGLTVGVGSRDPGRSLETVEGLSTRWGLSLTTLTATTNEEAARSSLVVLATPWEVMIKTIDPIRSLLANKVVVCLANALVKVGSEFVSVTVPRGSSAQLLQSALPMSRVVAALHHVPARELANLARPVPVDTLVCSDFSDAKEQVIGLLTRIEGMRALDAGTLAQAGAIESLTAVLLNINLRYKTRASIKLTGIDEVN
ncbi:MAG: NADPH-dependent F420 reductase [Ferrimicrobium sp.]